MMRVFLGMLFLYGICNATPKTAFVVNGLGETISRINLEEQTVENDVTTLGLAPNWVCEREKMVYVVNSTSDDIYIIDIQTNLVIDSILLPEGCNPYAMEFLNDSIAYVSAFCANCVFCINVKRREIIETIPVGLSPEGICISENRVFVAITAYDPNTYTWGDGMVYIIDASSNSVTDSVSVGVNPQSLEFTPDGELYVVCTGDYWTVTGVIYRIDGIKNQIIDSLITGGTPLSISISPDGIAWIGAGGWTDNGYVYMIDTNSDSILYDSSNPILVGNGVLGVACDDEGKGYICSFGADVVTVLDEEGIIINTFNVGDGPQAIVIYEPPEGIEEEENYQLTISNEKLAVYPNPFRDNTVISLSMGVWEHGCMGDTPSPPNSLTPLLKIYDLSGRLIKRFTVHGSQFTVTWDGRDKNGKRVENGVYFVKVHGLAEKVILLR